MEKNLKCDITRFNITVDKFQANLSEENKSKATKHLTLITKKLKKYHAKKPYHASVSTVTLFSEEQETRIVRYVDRKLK